MESYEHCLNQVCYRRFGHPFDERDNKGLTHAGWRPVFKEAAELYTSQFQNSKTINTKYNIDISDALRLLDEAGRALKKLESNVS